MVNRTQVGVEFIDEQYAQSELLEPDDDVRAPRWRTRAAIVGLVGIVLIAGTLMQDQGPWAKKASPVITRSPAVPRLSCASMRRLPFADLRVAITQTRSWRLARIGIDQGAVRVDCLVVGGPRAVTRSIPARYEPLLITVKVSSGKRRRVIVTVSAPQRAHIPVLRLHRMADQLGALARDLRARLAEVYAEHTRWAVRARQLVILDEAGLAGTRPLDRIAAQAAGTGATVVLVGDWAQLSAIDAAAAVPARQRPR